VAGMLKHQLCPPDACCGGGVLARYMLHSMMVDVHANPHSTRGPPVASFFSLGSCSRHVLLTARSRTPIIVSFLLKSRRHFSTRRTKIAPITFVSSHQSAPQLSSHRFESPPPLLSASQLPSRLLKLRRYFFSSHVSLKLRHHLRLTPPNHVVKLRRHFQKL
jgi:hypothetical protein